MLAVGQRKVLFGQLIGQLLVAMSLAGGTDFWHLFDRQRIEVALDLSFHICKKKMSIVLNLIKKKYEHTLEEVIMPGGTHVYPTCFGSIFEVCISGLKPSLSRTVVNCSW